MSYMLRKISRSKWTPNLERDPSNYTADAITGCTRTMRNTLSVWQSDSKDFKSDTVKELIVALATTMSRPDAIDLLWLDSSVLRDEGLDIKDELGESKYLAINPRHRDLSDLDHAKLGNVSKHIVEQLGDGENVIRVSRNDLIDMVYEWSLKENTFALVDLDDRWQDALRKKSPT